MQSIVLRLSKLAESLSITFVLDEMVLGNLKKINLCPHSRSAVSERLQLPPEICLKHPTCPRSLHDLLNVPLDPQDLPGHHPDPNVLKL